MKYDPATGEPNWDQMGEENVIANMTMCGIVGIEVRKTFIKYKVFEILTLTSKLLRQFVLINKENEEKNIF